MDRTTFTFRDALGRPVADEAGRFCGALADLEVVPLADGTAAVELVVRNGPGVCVVPDSGVLAFDDIRLSAVIASRDRVWGGPGPGTLRVRADYLHADAIDLGGCRLVRVRDARLRRLGDRTVVAEAVVVAPGRFRSSGLAWIPWTSLIPLKPLLAGRLAGASLARLEALPPLRLATLLASLKVADRERWTRVVGAREEPQ